jgi:cytochrome c553
MTIKPQSALLISLLAAASSGFSVGEVNVAAKKAAQCVSCHGAEGISGVSLIPNLAGQKMGYLNKQLQDYKSGARKGPVMTDLIKPLSDQDIKDIAAHFSAMKPAS